MKPLPQAFAFSVLLRLLLHPVGPTLAFVTPFFQIPKQTSFSKLHSQQLPSSEALLQVIQDNKEDEQTISSYISKLESSESVVGIPTTTSTSTNETTDEQEVDFDPLIGLYEVSYVKTARPKDNPVGGKWTRKSGLAQKLLRTRRTFQHILPVNTTGLGSLIGEGREAVGEAVNVISLEALWGLLRLSVILRGDAIPLTLEERTNATRVVQPLSSFAVKALFDAPRIVVGKKGRILNINVGPQTSVLLDTLYCDNKLRLGMGGTSGSRFVFRRCPDDDEEANEFRSLLAKPMKKRNPIACLGGIAALGVVGAVRGYFRMASGLLATFAVSLAALIAFSGGGIERDDMSIAMRKVKEQSSGVQRSTA